jgi:hypothetical protein
MEEKALEGTILSKLKPIVTMLTDTLVKDFCPAYRHQRIGELDFWIRTAEDGTETPVSDDQLRKDVEAWLLDLESRMETESDRAYAQIVTRMIRKNNGWVTLLTNRVKKRLTQ